MRKYFFLIGLLFFVLSPLWASATDLININTADKATLMTLTGLGGTGVKAQAVIDYRVQYGPFSTIEDLMKVSGIGQSTFDGFKARITVGDVAIQAATTPTDATSTPVVTIFSGSASTYTPPPSTLSIKIMSEQDARLEVPLRLSAQVTTKGGAVDAGASIAWSFGDGSRGEGSAVEKTYRYAGTYLVIATATDGAAKAHDELTVTVKSAQVRLLPVSGDGITIMNDSNDRLDLSNWRLNADTGSFRIPEGTVILPQAGVLFPFAITNLPVTFDATLLYPNGIVAARVAPPVPSVTVATSNIPVSQPLPAVASYKQVQTVEPIISQGTSVQAHEEAVLAPATVPNEGTVAGAATSSLAAVEAAPVPKARTAGLFHSPWTLSLFGVVALAGGAFILL